MTATSTPFGHALEELRLRAGLSQISLARLAGVNPSYVSRMERGDRRPPKRDIVQALADALGAGTVGERRLLVAAGYTAVEDWDPVLQAVADVLSDQKVDDKEREFFRTAVMGMAAQWRRGR